MKIAIVVFDYFTDIDVFSGKRATTHPNVRALLECFPVQVIDAPFVREGNVATADLDGLHSLTGPTRVESTTGFDLHRTEPRPSASALRCSLAEYRAVTRPS